MIPKHVAILSFEGPDRLRIDRRPRHARHAARPRARRGGTRSRARLRRRPAREAGRAVRSRRHAASLVAVDLEAASAQRVRRRGREGPRLGDERAARGSSTSWRRPRTRAGEHVLVICEEWQTANVAIAIDRLARERNVRGALTLMWNANNTYGFEKVHWPTLTRAAAVTCVSKYMKFELAQWNVHALVIPNGIDEALLVGADAEQTAAFREAFARASDVRESRPLRSGQELAPGDRRDRRAARRGDRRALDRARRQRAVRRRRDGTRARTAAHRRAARSTRAATGASSRSSSKAVTAPRSCTCGRSSTSRRCTRCTRRATRCWRTAGKSRSGSSGSR